VKKGQNTKEIHWEPELKC